MKFLWFIYYVSRHKCNIFRDRNAAVQRVKIYGGMIFENWYIPKLGEHFETFEKLPMIAAPEIHNVTPDYLLCRYYYLRVAR